MATRKIQQTRDVNAPSGGGFATHTEVRVVALTDDSVNIFPGTVVDPDTEESDWAQAPYTDDNFTPEV